MANARAPAAPFLLLGGAFPKELPLPARPAARLLVGGLTVAALLAPGATAHADGSADDAASATTTVGLHNAYEKAKFDYLADALDSGSGLVEIDVWTDDLIGAWRVNHDLVGQQNNCVGATDPAGLRSGNANGNLRACLTDMRTWHEATPDHQAVVVKVEMKDGFYGRGGLGPAEFDDLVAATLGDAVYRPADLLGDHPDLDSAARSGDWDSLAGRFLIELVPGTFEQRNPFDTLWTDEEYGRHLRDLSENGTLGSATAFPAVLGAASGDPRTRYPEDLRPWFVVFDGSATSYLNGIDTGWYVENNYLLVMTGAHSVSPEISATGPSEQEAADRVALLAAAGATTVTSDWSDLPTVLGSVLPRG
ncbi:hypothetical protein [Nocardiopsis ansamitocini]|uniref:Lipoprotein n=1 Tax=Nocardiopsis ansamitocini TaxID=1670832 RepID=A0A9W6P3M2_9ACTN|nr:hypothetical protein [Nocardiopsis ansamitocini]GLU46556.1 lipoprotein [Nocardiopsis ansamitocini]